MNREKINSKLESLGFKQGQLHKLKSNNKKIFWVDGPSPAIVQYLTDENESVTKEYVSGRNGWEAVNPGEVLLFLGPSEVEVSAEDAEHKFLQQEYQVLKWLFHNKILFWSLDGLDGEANSKLEEIFEVVGEQEIPTF